MLINYTVPLEKASIEKLAEEAPKWEDHDGTRWGPSRLARYIINEWLETRENIVKLKKKARGEAKKIG